jgi:DNA-binding MarR family transcriptional regulator
MATSKGVTADRGVVDEEVDYAAWADFRYEIRRWIRISETVSKESEVPPQHHQLMLAIKGFRGEQPPSVSDLAERLQLRHHSVVGLLDRMEAGGLVERRPTGEGRTLAILLTRDGELILAAISRELQPELQVAAQRLIRALTALTRAPSARSRAPGRHIGSLADGEVASRAGSSRDPNHL